MIELKEGMLLYHGSYTPVSTIDLNKCRPGKDFGRGFYVTSSLEQAERFVPLSVKKQIAENNLPAGTSIGYISVFQLHLTPELAFCSFESANTDWLHLVAANRRKKLFPEIEKQYAHFDIIGGKIANDRTSATLQLYTAGAYGIPGSDVADSIAIQTLLPNRLEDQFCFRSEQAIQSLVFLRSDRYDFS